MMNNVDKFTMQKERRAEVVDTDKPASLTNADAKTVAANDGMCDLLGYSLGELRGMTVWKLFKDCRPKDGRKIERVLDGEKLKAQTGKLERKNGSLIKTTCNIEPVETNGETLIKTVVNDWGEVEDDSCPAVANTDVFDDVSSKELDDIARNIRVDAPDGTMNLAAIMTDLAVGHNEIEQYKKGALSLYQAIDERLQEEKKRNPDSEEVAVLREVKCSAFGLYLRIQRGDEELHGERDGRYSGYFDS